MVRILIASLFAVLSLCGTAYGQRDVVVLSPDEAIELGIRIGFEEQPERFGQSYYLVGMDAKERVQRRAFQSFKILVQKQPTDSTEELTARMWHLEWPQGTFYTSFEIEESFLPFLNILVTYGKSRNGIIYKIPIQPYLTRKQTDLPRGLIDAVRAPGADD
ncbi:MAG: hypothetical protein AAGF10_02585 [Verrucomicrobiota bacterium]